MPDHCHFLVRIPEPQTISEIMRTYKMGLAFQLGISKLWQPRFHIRTVDSPSAALSYIHANPTRKALCIAAEDYPWSSASGKWDVSTWEL